MFYDEARIEVRSGRGGDGCMSFRREKFIPEGGPDGGDGGDGGDVVLVVNPHLNTLQDFVRQRHWKAGNGVQGSGRQCSGKKGDDCIIALPPGTLVRHAETGELLADMCNADERVIIAAGGEGGLGNVHFKSSVNQTPRKFTPGGDPTSLPLELELKLIADVGLLGFPNAGKSTLISRLSAAKPKVANYPFTTLTPNLGVMTTFERQIIIADIPGLIEGAAEGVGLGHQFLRHVERCRFLLHLLDGCDGELEDIVDRFGIINRELKRFSPELALRPQYVVLNKIDAIAEPEKLCKELQDALGVDEILGISAVTGTGIQELQRALIGRIIEE